MPVSWARSCYGDRPEAPREERRPHHTQHPPAPSEQSRVESVSGAGSATGRGEFRQRGNRYPCKVQHTSVDEGQYCGIQASLFRGHGKDGKFALKGLPAGTYTVTAWQEKLGTLTQKVTVGAREEKKLDFVFKSQAGA